MTDHLPDAGKMMPAALRLADALEAIHYHNADSILALNVIKQAATELCRLHTENEAKDALLRQALNALDPPEHLRLGGTGRLKAAAIAALRERLK